MNDFDQRDERVLYVIPGEKAKVGKCGSCWVFTKGNQKPQKQFQNVDTYLQNWLSQQEETFHEKKAIEYLSKGAKGVGRGKVILVPNGQILFPIPILPGKGNTGYVSLGDIKGVSGTTQKEGFLLFQNGETPLLTAEKTGTLYDKVCKGKSRYCKGFSTAEFIWEFHSQREKLCWTLQHPLSDKESILDVDQTLLTAFLENLQNYPPEEQARIIRDSLRQMKRIESWRAKNGIPMMDLQKAFLQRCLPSMPTKEEVRRIVTLAKQPDQLLPVEELVARSEQKPTYWSARYAGNEKGTDRLSPGQKMYLTSGFGDHRTVVVSPKTTESGGSGENRLAEVIQRVSEQINQNRELVNRMMNPAREWMEELQRCYQSVARVIEPMKPLVLEMQSFEKALSMKELCSSYMAETLVPRPDISQLTGHVQLPDMSQYAGLVKGPDITKLTSFVQLPDVSQYESLVHPDYYENIPLMQGTMEEQLPIQDANQQKKAK